MSHRTRLLLFFGLSWAISWIVWAPYVAGRMGWTAEASSFLHLLGSLGPAAAALMVAKLDRACMAALRESLALRRPRVGAWCIALGGPAALLALGAAVQTVVGGITVEPMALVSSLEFPSLSVGALLGAQIFFYGLGEELGWRGFAFPLLAPRLGGYWASVLLTAPWAIWHLPLLISSHLYNSLGLAGLAGWLFSLLCGSLLMGWLFRFARGSVLPVAVFHGLLDLAMANAGMSKLGVNAIGAAVSLAGLAAGFALWRTDRALALPSRDIGEDTLQANPPEPARQ